MSLTAAGLKTGIGGLAGGALHADRDGGGRLVHYSDIAGVTLDGYVAPDLAGNGLFIAYVRIGGRARGRGPADRAPREADFVARASGSAYAG